MVWFGIVIIVLVETALITPPVGLNLFVLQGLTGREMPYIARAAFPFFLLLLLAVVLIWVFPALVLHLPGLM
jgi:TRAP-type C4-dicarboxylate transport system permease large subunit